MAIYENNLEVEKGQEPNVAVKSITSQSRCQEPFFLTGGVDCVTLSLWTGRDEQRMVDCFIMCALVPMLG